MSAAPNTRGSVFAQRKTLRFGLRLAAAAVAFEAAVTLTRDALATNGVEQLGSSPNGRYLVTPDGRPFFYLGDTAWELFHRLNREEAELYLTDRARKGFTVIQAVVLAELDGLHAPNAYGHTPLVDDDPTRPAVKDGPDNDYWDHVDWIVGRAESLGLFIGMLPTWGDKWNKKWGVGPEIFTPENARTCGRWLGSRYRDRPIIWILGGDRNPETPGHLAVIRAMAQGLREGDGGRHLMTYHPMGGSHSAQWFHADDWLAFNMFQSGHGALHFPNYRTTLALRERTPIKPVLDGEPRYEDHPVNWKQDSGWFDDWDVRQAAYWSMLSGACGHTYGNHNIWQMYEPPRRPISHARTAWKTALRHPGAEQMGLMRSILTQRPFHKLLPDQSLIRGFELEGGDHRRAARAEDDSFALAYLPTGGELTVTWNPPGARRIRIWWFDPRTGDVRMEGEKDAEGAISLRAPGEGRGNDWLLILDNVSADLPPLEKASVDR
ncbi:MAG: glycoside hydrolase family 140 protein [Thermogutta sp.]